MKESTIEKMIRKENRKMQELYGDMNVSISVNWMSDVLKVSKLYQTQRKLLGLDIPDYLESGTKMAAIDLHSYFGGKLDNPLGILGESDFLNKKSYGVACAALEELGNISKLDFPTIPRDFLKGMEQTVRLFKEKDDLIKGVCVGATVALKDIGNIGGNDSFAVQSDFLKGMEKSLELFRKVEDPLKGYWDGVLNTLQNIAPNNPYVINEYLASIENLEDWSELCEEVYFSELEMETFFNTSDENLVSPEEFEGIFREYIENSAAFWKKTANWAKEKKQKHYILCKILGAILFIIWGIFLEPYAQDKIGIPVMTQIETLIIQQPEKDAESICRVCQGTGMVVTENVNDYYKVTFVDENGEEREEYVAKEDIDVVEKRERDIE